MIAAPSPRALDVVGIYDQDFRQLVEGARPVKAIVHEEARVMEHPLEDGATITDHRVMLPVEVELSLLLRSPRDDYSQLRGIYRRAELVTVMTRSGAYANMLIQALPHDEDPALFGTIPLALRLREVKLVQAQFQALPPRQVASARDASTKRRGEQTTTQADGETAGRASALYRIVGLDKGGG